MMPCRKLGELFIRSLQINDKQYTYGKTFELSKDTPQRGDDRVYGISRVRSNTGVLLRY